MFYPDDFPSKPNNKSVNPFIIYKRDFHLRNKKNLCSTTNPNSNNRNILDGEKDKNFKHKLEDLSFWERFCYHTTIHGIKYIAQKELHWSERYILNENINLFFFILLLLKLLVLAKKTCSMYIFIKL